MSLRSFFKAQTVRSFFKAKVHFIGIGGIGMCGLAELLKNMGTEVSGSDLSENAQVVRLRGFGIPIHIGHSAEHVKGADVVVYSSAVKPSNPEFAAALTQGIPLIPRAEALAEIMRLKRGIAVGGSHGKTTTTSMLAAIFLQAEMKPTIVVGGRLDLIKSTALLGTGEWMIAEADESDGSFSKLNPEVAVITNIDNDHLDHYGNLNQLKKAFFEFAARVPFYGAAVVCWDDPMIRETFQHFGKKLVRYGFNSDCDLRLEGGDGNYSVFENQSLLGSFVLNVPGKHNALNALAAIAVAREAGIDFDQIKAGLALFKGVDRRFQHRGAISGVDIFDDYGHHPTEIQAVVAAYREKFGTRYLSVVFQPHRFSRTQLCWDQFKTCFAGVDQLFLADIYSAGEEPIMGVDSDELAKVIAKHEPAVKIIRVLSKPSMSSHLGEISQQVLASLPADSAVFTLGAGDVYKLAAALLEQPARKN